MRQQHRPSWISFALQRAHTKPRDICLCPMCMSIYVYDNDDNVAAACCFWMMMMMMSLLLIDI